MSLRCCLPPHCEPCVCAPPPGNFSNTWTGARWCAWSRLCRFSANVPNNSNADYSMRGSSLMCMNILCEYASGLHPCDHQLRSKLLWPLATWLPANLLHSWCEVLALAKQVGFRSSVVPSDRGVGFTSHDIRQLPAIVCVFESHLSVLCFVYVHVYYFREKRTRGFCQRHAYECTAGAICCFWP